jgi:hypothetical protein
VSNGGSLLLEFNEDFFDRPDEMGSSLLPSNLHLPNWLLAILLLSVITTRLYQTSRFILYIVPIQSILMEFGY